MVSYCAKLICEDLSSYSNKFESVGLRKAYRQISQLTVSTAKCLHFFALYIKATRTAGIDRYEEITSLQHAYTLHTIKLNISLFAPRFVNR